MKRRVASYATVFLALLVGCRGNPDSPSGPGVATITGSVLAVAESGAASAASDRWLGHDPGTALTGVLVVGTIIGSDLDALNRFRLLEVPEGHRQLLFLGPTVSVTLDVPAVRAGEAIEIGVGLTPASVMVDSIHRVSGTSEQMDGRVETLSPSPPALRVAGRPIVVTADTRIVQNGGSVTFAAIGIGMRVSARGSTSGGALSAASIEIRDADADQPISVHGQVANVSGGEQAFAFEIGGRLIRGDQSTRFIEGSRFEGLASGVRAEVNARQQDGFLHAVEIKIE